MSLEGAVRSRLVSWLRPWLRAEPDTELKLGFLGCQATFRDLELDPSELDNLVKASTRLEFRRVTVAEITFRFNPWRSPRVRASARGFHVVLAPRDPTEGSSSFMTEDLISKEHAVSINSLDPEGALLRTILENAVKRASSGSWLRTSLMEALLQHCRLQLQDICLQLQYNEDCHAFLLKAEELTVGPWLPNTSNKGRRITSLSFPAKNESCSLMLNSTCLEFGLKENDLVKILVSLKDPNICIRLAKMDPIGFEIHFPLIDSGFSPSDFPSVLLLLDIFTKSKCSRNGKLLWRIAARRVPSLIHHPRISWYKLVSIVLLWLSYVRAYESLLSLVGYHNESIFEESFMKICSNIELKNRLQYQLRMVDELERQLPVEAAGRARHIARCQVLATPHVDVPELTTFSTKLKNNLFLLLFFVWNFFCVFFHLMRKTMLILRNYFAHRVEKINSSKIGVCIGSSVPQNYVSLTVSELCISLHPTSVGHAALEANADTVGDMSLFTLSPLSLDIASFCLSYVVNRIGSSVFMVLGAFQVHLSPSSRVPVMESDSVTGTAPSFKVPRAETGDISQVIMRSEPAHLLHQEDSSASTQQPIAATRATILKNSLREMWSSWKMLGQELEVDKFDWMDHPFFLFELKNFLIIPGITKTVGNSLRCNIALGKVTFDLEYSSMVSLARLTRQVIDSLHWMTNITKSHDASISHGIVTEKNAIKLEKKLEYFFFRMKSATLNIMPESNIQIGAMIAGPTINLSFPDPKDKEFIHALSSFSLDLDGIEISAWPAKQSALLALNQGSELEDPESYLWLKEPQLLDIPKGQVSESFVSQGIMSHNLSMRLNSLILFFKSLEDNRRFQIFGFTFMEINASACRHYTHSFYSTENACSLSLSGMAGEADVLLYLDEIYTLFQAFEGIYCMSPRIPTKFDSTFFGSQEYINKCLSVKRVTKDVRMDVHEEEDTNLFHRSAQFVFDADFELGPIRVVLNKSREKNFTRMKTDNATNDAATSRVKFLTCSPAYGIENFLPKSCFHISGTERHVKMLMNTAEVRSVICKPQIDDDAFRGESMIRNYDRPTEQLCEAAISSFVLHLSAGYDVSYMFEKRSAYSQITLQSVEKGACSFLPISGKGSVNQLHGSHQDLPSESIVPGFCLITEIELGQTFIAECSMKNLLSGQQSSWLQLLISSCGSSHTIKSDSQGGSCFLATSALAMFIQTLKAYSVCLSCLRSLMSKSSMRKSEKAGASIVLNDSLARPSNQDGQEYNETINYLPFSLETWTFGFLKSLDVNVSQFYVTFAVADASDGLQCLTLEVELQLASLAENLSFSLSKLTIHSKHLHKESLSEKKVNLIPFSSRINNICDPSKNELSGLNVSQFQIAFSEREISLNCDNMGSFSLNHLNYILKHLTASIMLKRMALSSEVAAFPSKSNWVGSGSISGFDLTLTISEIQMLLALYAPFAGKSDMKSAAGSKRTFTFPAQGSIDQSDATIPDGAIVAIQDIRQHLYFAIEAVGEKYRVVSTVHYSLVGDQALFKVKWHQQKRSLLSLISLHAKKDSGKSLRLNFLPGSRFVEISSNDDKGHALWKVIPYKHENYGDEDIEFYRSCTSLRKAFHLVNNKNNSGVAFLGGSPEFVQKPGSPFKLKVLHELTQASCAYTAQDQSNISTKDESRHARISSLMHMDLTIDRIVFTICHEIADADDKFPLLCGCIGDVHLIGQLLPSKFRLICTYFVTLDYFYAHQNVWRKIISPVDACIFLHSRVAVKRSENIKKGMPTHCHFRIEQVDASLTELSLDILLFVAGKLNMVGLYALRSSIFCNCCKVSSNFGTTFALSFLCYCFNLNTNTSSFVSAFSCLLSVQKKVVFFATDLHFRHELR